MTIREKYAKFSRKQLANALYNLNKKIRDYEESMNEYRESGDAEMFGVVKTLRDEAFATYLDVRAAYVGSPE